MYKSLGESVNLKPEQLCLCRCPHWCEEGYQVATWNGSEFEYSADPNGSFNDHVIAFMPLDDEGCPSVIREIKRRRDLILSEPEGIVREQMINNLAIDL